MTTLFLCPARQKAQASRLAETASIFNAAGCKKKKSKITYCDRGEYENDDAPLDPVEQLPPITTTGANTFGCLLNGEPWVVCGGSLKTSRLSASYGFQSSMLQIVGQRWCKASRDNIYLVTIADGPGVHEYKYAEYDNREIECQDVLDPYSLLEGADNRIEILRLDKENYIMSGTFQCTLVHAKCGDTIHITEGRFDYKWAN